VRRVAVELPVVAVVAAMMASLVLAAGTSIQPPAQPILLPARPAEHAVGDTERCLSAPVTAVWAAGAVGKGILCYEGRALRIALHVADLAPGEVYTAWLSYKPQPAPCHDSPCGPVDLPGEQPSGLMQQIGSGVAPASRTLDLAADLRDVQLVSGAQISLLLLRPNGLAGPRARAVFAVP
jgi:hypothetical protein